MKKFISKYWTRILSISLIFAAALHSHCAHADPKFKKGNCVKFSSQSYGNCSGETIDVDYTDNYYYKLKIISCSSLYGEDEETGWIIEDNLRPCPRIFGTK